MVLQGWNWWCYWSSRVCEVWKISEGRFVIVGYNAEESNAFASSGWTCGVNVDRFITHKGIVLCVETIYFYLAWGDYFRFDDIVHEKLYF